MGECVMSTCDQPSGPGGLCDEHYAQANPDMNVIRAHMEREHAIHPTTVAWAKERHERKQRGEPDDWILLGKDVQVIQRQRADEIAAKVDREILAYLVPKEVARVYGKPVGCFGEFEFIGFTNGVTKVADSVEDKESK